MNRYRSTTARRGAGTAAHGTGASLLTRLAAGLLAATATGALLLLVPPAAPAAAHNRLVDSDPAAGATLAEPPQRVELVFAERLNPSYTTVAVTDAAGQSVETTGPDVDGTRCVVTFPQPLPAGTYTVAFRVVSRDGHPVQDSFQFTVESGPDASPSAAAPSPAQPSPSAPPPAAGETDPPATTPVDPAASDAAEDGSGGTPVLLVVAGVALLVAAAGGLLWWRRRAGPHGEAGV
ncbi:MAG TPA: copper resistance CopC family protein [Natronosporangium sp.]|nr:copper resistance CopC family protein [Natronosporangium sp.]